MPKKIYKLHINTYTLHINMYKTFLVLEKNIPLEDGRSVIWCLNYPEVTLRENEITKPFVSFTAFGLAS